MHIHIITEDKSCSILIKEIMNKILSKQDIEHTFEVRSYSGVGHIPKNLHSDQNRKTKMLLNNLPPMMKAMGKTFHDCRETFPAALVVVVDLDRRNCIDFKKELLGILNECHPAPRTLFRIAIEETEAWLLGDANAIKTAYPNVKRSSLDKYENDSICDTWELLADAIYRGGHRKLLSQGYPKIGMEKCQWAEKIAPHMNLEENKSPSFQCFRRGIETLLQP